MNQPIYCAAKWMLLLLASSTVAIGAETNKGVVRFRLAEEKQADELEKAVLSGDRAIYLHPETIINESDIEEVSFGRNPRMGGIEIKLKMKKAGAKKLAAATKAHLRKPMAITVDGKVIFAPVIQSVISDHVMINGRFSDDDMLRMLSVLVLQKQLPKR